jgi:predicted RNA-binding Zn-ribbon protein involved in translation (DUF1610 family)
MDTSWVERVLKELNANFPCPFCGNDEWIVSDEMGLVPSLAEGNVIQLGRGVPVIVVVCNNCGYINLHWATALERLDPEREQRPGDGEDAQEKPG